MKNEYKMSAAGLEELKKELNFLKTTRSDEVAEMIKVARGFGDLSENSEYDEAKNEQGKLYSRIAELEEIILHAVVIEEGNQPLDQVTIGSTVTVSVVKTGMTRTMKIVGSQEANAMAGVISRKEFSLKGGLLLTAIVGLTVLSVGNYLPVWSAYVLWAIFIVFMVSNLIEGKKSAGAEKSDDFDKKEIPLKALFFVLGTAAIVFGAEFLVSSGKTIASGIGISETIIGFTVIALGTSLPELVTTLTAIRKKESSLSVGNIIGANIIDTTLILPLCAVINGQPLPVDKVNLVFDFPVCIAACAVAVVPTIIQGRFKKWQGYALLAIYALYMIMLVFNEIGIVALG